MISGFVWDLRVLSELSYDNMSLNVCSEQCGRIASCISFQITPIAMQMQKQRVSSTYLFSDGQICIPFHHPARSRPKSPLDSFWESTHLLPRLGSWNLWCICTWTYPDVFATYMQETLESIRHTPTKSVLQCNSASSLLHPVTGKCGRQVSPNSGSDLGTAVAESSGLNKACYLLKPPAAKMLTSARLGEYGRGPIPIPI